jgi:FkbM family methyltransferase
MLAGIWSAAAARVFRTSKAAAPAQKAALLAEAVVTFALPNGLSCEFDIRGLDDDAYIGALREGGLQDTTWRFFISWVRKDDVVFDLRANIGAFAIPAAVIGAQVHAFEILPANVVSLAASAARNGLDNLAINIGAIWDKPGFLGIAGKSAWGVVAPGSQLSIAAVAIDDYVAAKGIEQVDLMKIDIEGAELEALRGADNVLRDRKPDIVFECNAVTCGNRGYSLKELQRLLESKGYRLFRLALGRLCPWRSDLVQEVIYADYFATMRSDEDIFNRSGWPIAALTDGEIAANFVDQDKYNDLHKAYAAAVADELSPHFAADDAIGALVARWLAQTDASTRDIMRIGGL